MRGLKIVPKRLQGFFMLLGGVAGLAIVLSGFFGSGLVGASSANVSHSYQAAGSIPNGSLVSLDSKKNDYVQTANLSNGSRLVGVALAGDDSLLAINAQTSKVQVATSGTVKTLVSTINGPIKSGDQIAVSAFAGIGMRTPPGAYVIGLAQSSFSADSEGASQQTVTDKDGKKTRIAVGYVQLNIAVGTAAAATAGQADDLNGLQKVAKGIMGHAVSTLRIVVSLVVAVVALVALITLIYAAVYGGIVSIGRNPLAKYAIFRTMGGVIGLALLTAFVAGLTIFFLLR